MPQPPSHHSDASERLTSTLRDARASTIPGASIKVSLLLLAYLFFCLLSQTSLLPESLKYLPIAAVIVIIFICREQVLFSNRHFFTAGGLLVIIGAGVSTFMEGDAQSWAYLLFIFLNLLLYPIFQTSPLKPWQISSYYLFMLICTIPMGLANNRVQSIFGNPNNYGSVAFIALYFGILAFYKKPWLQLPVVFFAVVTTILSGSRTALGVIVLFVGLYVVQRFVLHTVLNRLSLVVLTLMAVAYITLVTDDRFKVLDAIQAYKYSDKSERGLSHRDDLYQVSLEVSLDHPLGVGLGRSPIYIEREFGESLSPHNMYLKMLMEGGVVFLLGYMILLIGMLLTTKSPLVLSFLLAMALRGLFESATPFTLSLISAMLILPYFLNEQTVDWGKPLRITLTGR